MDTILEGVAKGLVVLWILVLGIKGFGFEAVRPASMPQPSRHSGRSRLGVLRIRVFRVWSLFGLVWSEAAVMEHHSERDGGLSVMRTLFFFSTVRPDALALSIFWSETPS